MNDIIELRRHLFETLQDLRNKDKPMDLDRAKAISDVAQTVINSAKVEVDYMKQTGETSGSSFLNPELKALAGSGPTSSGKQTVVPVTGGNVISHRMR